MIYELGFLRTIVRMKKIVWLFNNTYRNLKYVWILPQRCSFFFLFIMYGWDYHGITRRSWDPCPVCPVLLYTPTTPSTPPRSSFHSFSSLQAHFVRTLIISSDCPITSFEDPLLYNFSFSFLVVLGVEPRALWILGRHSATELKLHSKASFLN